MKLFICPNRYTPQQVDAARRVVRALERGLEAQCALSSQDSQIVFGCPDYAGFSPDECDFIVSVGGDGAVLRAAQTALRADKPLLGINGGRLGYLCALDLKDIESITPETLMGWPLSQRTLLTFSNETGEHWALNDVVIGKHGFGETVELHIQSGDAMELSLRGDGVILATPTGSTAYNLSAGGPILMPDAACFTLTPICAHFSQRCARVLSDSSTIVLSRRPSTEADVYADGVPQGPLNQPLVVSKARKTLALLAPRRLEEIM